MKVIKLERYECDWCEDTQEFDGEHASEKAGEAGWVVLDRHPEKELTFCSIDCLLSYL